MDECAAGADDCSQVCLDTIGSFECDCLDGYQLSKDGHTCHGLLLKVQLLTVPICLYCRSQNICC